MAFVGRDEEIRLLESLLAGAESRAPAVVLLDGEAGVGKTRLLGEFTTLATAAGAFVLAGGCVPFGGGAIPYGPLTEALRLLVRRHGVAEVRKLAGPSWPELAGLIADFTGDAPATGSQLRMFGAVSRLLDHIGARVPVVLVFEDVHWADPSTLDLIAYLTRTKSNERMMLVCSYRSGLPPDDALRRMLAEPEFTKRTNRIRLGRVGGAHLRRLITELVGGPVSPERMERYVELSEGNPYFAEQLVAADDRTSPTVRLPESLNEIMRVRLEQLSEAATRVVRVAAVAGRRVSDRLLATVLADDSTVDDALRECLDSKVLLVDDDGYAFQHALLREAAYDLVSPRDRRRLHAETAAALTLDLDAHPVLLPQLAHHWFAAGRRPEALDSAVRAGDHAVRLRAFREAETQYRRALELWPLVPDAEKVAGADREHVLWMAADAARWAGHVAAAVDLARQAIDEVAENPARAGELYERLGSYLWEAGKTTESVEAYREAHRKLAGLPPSAAGARVRSALATAAVRGGQHTEALALAERAVDEARSVGARPEEGRALNSSGLALTMLGRAEEGEAALRASLRIASEVDHLEDLLRAYGNLGVCLEHSGGMAAAVDAMLEGLDKARALGVLRTRQAGVLANNAGVALFRLGRWREAADLLDEVLLDRPPSETVYLRLTKAEIDVASGRFAQAEHLLESVRSQPNADPGFITSLYSCLTELAIWRGNLADACRAARHGVEAVARTENTRALLQLCAIGLRVAADDQDERAAAEFAARARQADGHAQHEESAVLLRVCEAEHRRLSGTDGAALWHDVARTWADLAWPYPRAYALVRECEAAVRDGARPVAAAAAGAALSVVEELGATPLLDRVSALVKRHRLNPAAKGVAHPAGLTDRELEVLGELVAGLTNGEISKKLFISIKTVSVHVSNILRKLGVDNRTRAAAVAREMGL